MLYEKSDLWHGQGKVQYEQKPLYSDTINIILNA